MIILQTVAPTASDTAQAGPPDLFVLVLLGYAAFFLFRFFRPVLEHSATDGFYDDLRRLEELVEGDAEKKAAADPEETRIEELVAGAAEVQKRLHTLRVQATIAEGSGLLDVVARLRNGEIPLLERRQKEIAEEERALRLSVRRGATDRMQNLQSLQASYTHPLVRDAVQQLASQFPQGQYQRFDLSLLPTFTAFSERVAAARSMAGVFVLLGLLGTMIQLNGVVAQVSRFARQQEMESSEFLDRMGELMQGIGGAFTNSIFGVMLAVAALILVSWINAGFQRRVTALETSISQKVVPTLTRIHNWHLPEFALADILRTTGGQLDALNTTVLGLTTGMEQALSSLGRTIGEMLQQFGSYQKQYKQLNDWVSTLEDASTEMRGAASALTRSADRMAEPIDEMNVVLRAHLQAQSEFQSSGHLDRLLDEIKEVLTAGWREQSGIVARIAQASEDSLSRAVAAANEQTAAAKAQSEVVERELTQVTAALRATTGQQLSKVLSGLQATSEATGRRMEQSSAAFAEATLALRSYSHAPTLFAWLTSVAFPALSGLVRRRGRGAQRHGGNRGGATHTDTTRAPASPQKRAIALGPAQVIAAIPEPGAASSDNATG